MGENCSEAKENSMNYLMLFNSKMNGCEAILLLFLRICSDFRNGTLICMYLHILFGFPKSDSFTQLKHNSLAVTLNLFPTAQSLFEQHTPFSNTLCGFRKRTPAFLQSSALHTPPENQNSNTGTTGG